MKYSFISMVVLALLAFGFSPMQELAIGSQMPQADLPMQDVSGKKITLSKAATKNGLLVIFSCNTCPYVVKNQEATREILNYAKSKNIGIAVINSNEGSRGGADSYEAMKDYANAQQYQWIYAIDKDNVVADAFGATRTPECFLFDANGILMYHGAINNNPSEPESATRMHTKEAMNEMMAGKPVTIATSKSIGCSIKRVSKP